MTNRFSRSRAMARLAMTMGLSLFLPLAAAAGKPLDCPNELPTSAMQLANTPAGWKPFVPRPLKLTGAGFMQNSPEFVEDLVPYSTTEGKNRHTSTWKFSAEEAQIPEGIWLRCDYANGVISLSKQIDRSFRDCVVSYEKKDQRKRFYVIDVTCK